MGDEEDRMKLMAMTELDREMILSERADARDAARERRRAEIALKQAQEQQQRAAEKVHPRALSRAGLHLLHTERPPAWPCRKGLRCIFVLRRPFLCCLQGFVALHSSLIVHWH